jgi:hypothetical protein
VLLRGTCNKKRNDFFKECFVKSLMITLLSASFLTTVAAQARTVDFACEASDQPTLNRFEGTGQVEITGAKSEGTFSGSLTRGGRDTQPLDLGELSSKGSAQIIPPGKFAVGEVIVLDMQAERDAKPVHLAFNLGINNLTSSTLIVAGVPYRAKCSENK